MPDELLISLFLRSLRLHLIILHVSAKAPFLKANKSHNSTDEYLIDGQPQRPATTEYPVKLETAAAASIPIGYNKIISIATITNAQVCISVKTATHNLFHFS